jgi:hypothetical protein
MCVRAQVGVDVLFTRMSYQHICSVKRSCHYTSLFKFVRLLTLFVSAHQYGQVSVLISRFATYTGHQSSDYYNNPLLSHHFLNVSTT